MTKSSLEEAKIEDAGKIVSLLASMQTELRELEFNEHIFTESIKSSFQENVHWFLFKDENGEAFGTCYLQSLHNYWRREKRYYLGGFFILPSHRGQGHFRIINALLKDWAEQHDGAQIFSFIHKDNQKSLQSFASADFIHDDYLLCYNHWGK